MNIMPTPLPGLTRKDIEQLFILFYYYFFKFLFTATGRNAKRLYTLEALSNNEYHSRISTWMNQKGYRTSSLFFIFFFFLRLRVEMLSVLYILEALRHNCIMPGLLPG